MPLDALHSLDVGPPGMEASSSSASPAPAALPFSPLRPPRGTSPRASPLGASLGASRSLEDLPGLRGTPARFIRGRPLGQGCPYCATGGGPSSGVKGAPLLPSPLPRGGSGGGLLEVCGGSPTSRDKATPQIK